MWDGTLLQNIHDFSNEVLGWQAQIQYCLWKEGILPSLDLSGWHSWKEKQEPSDVHRRWWWGPQSWKTKQRIDDDATPARKREELKKRYEAGVKTVKNGTIAGLRHEEKEGLNRILDHGFGDVYRELHPNDYGFTYWDMKKVHFRTADNGTFRPS